MGNDFKLAKLAMRPTHALFAQKALAAYRHPLVKPAPPEDAAKQIAAQVTGMISEQLYRLGIYHRRQDGVDQRVQLRSPELIMQSDGRAWIKIEVDTTRLPLGRNTDDLTSEAVLRHLSAVCLQEIGTELVLANPNQGGVGYLTWLHEVAPKKPEALLPRRVPFDMSSRPATIGLHGSQGAHSTQVDWQIPLGVSTDGPQWFSPAGRGHLLVVGQSGSGKSTWMKAALAALSLGAGSESLQLAIIDPKVVEFAAWSRVRSLIAPIATTSDDATAVLERIVEEMDARKKLLVGGGYTDFQKYNRHASPTGDTRGERLPLVVVVFDEFVDLIEQASQSANGRGRSKLRSLLTQVITTGRAMGIVLILGTAEAKGEVLDTTIRRNCAYKVCFRVDDAVESRLVIGEPDAAHIKVNGRMLARIEGELIEAQGFYLDDAQMAQIIEGLSNPAPVAEAPPVLDVFKARLVTFCVTHLGGEFAVNRMFAQINDGLTSEDANYVVKHRIASANRELTDIGLLELLPKPGDPRKRKVSMVTQALRAELATFDQNRQDE